MWQYKTIRIARRGWRLVAVDNGFHYFERPLEKTDVLPADDMQKMSDTIDVLKRLLKGLPCPTN